MLDAIGDAIEPALAATGTNGRTLAHRKARRAR
jgi:hypothetical protein